MSKADEDLLVLARRGDLDDDDSRRFRELLATSPEARELYEAGRELDAEAAVVADDDLMFARIVRAAAARHRAATRPPRRWLARGLVAAILLAAITVGAAAVWRRPSSSATVRAPARVVPTASSRVAPAVPIRVAAEPVPPAPPPPAPPPPVPGRRVERTPAPAVEQTPVEPAPAAIVAPPTEPTEVVVAPVMPPAPSAGELFAAANRARIQGNAREAIERAEELERRYPTSKEAITTLVTLGMLHLKAGDAATALASFDAYVASGNTSMMAEALWGKSQALQALGRAADERTSLRQLVASYPHSAYTQAAKNRLGALE